MESEYNYDFGQRLAGRIVLVAGGSGGLGSATSALLASEGAYLVIGYLSNRERAERLKRALEQKYQAKVVLVQGDINDASARKRYIEAASQAGPLYGLVVFAGHPARVPAEELDNEKLAASFAANFAGPALLAQAASRKMLEQREGSIVFISSMQGVAPFEGSLAYGAPKAALAHAAKIFAREWGGPNGVRVNVVAPGVTTAGMAAESIRAGKYNRYLEAGIIKRFGRPEDIARAVRLLLEPDGYITGQVIVVDGGLTIRR